MNAAGESIARPDVEFIDATAEAEAVRDGRVSPAELVDAAIARIEAGNGELNAVIRERFADARVEAANQPLSGDPAAAVGGFAGVPMLLKDLGAQAAGQPQHQGSRGLARHDYTPTEDSSLYRRFREAGFIPLGRTNTPEFGTRVTTEPLAYGPTHNPHLRGYSPGGSSGGSAAAVAAGFVALAHANDGGGSIRVPAAHCGLIGLKPSRGRVSTSPDSDAWAGATIDGAVCRSVRDAAAVLDWISGPEPGDHYWAAPPTKPWSSLLTDPSAVGGLRIGMAAAPVWASEVDAEVSASVTAAGVLLESLGHGVEEAWPDALNLDAGGASAIGDDYLVVLMASMAADVAAFADAVGAELGADDLEPENYALAQLGQSISAADYLAANARLRRWERDLAQWWTHDFDLLVLPVTPLQPPPHGFYDDEVFGAERTQLMVSCTAPFNVGGQPAISLPLATSSTGLPIGVQLVAAVGREDQLIQVAGQVSDALGW